MYESITKHNVERLRAHPFIQRCRDGSITRHELDVFLIQQSKYSSYFTRYLCALISNLRTNDDVMHLAENLVEELGFGDQAGEPHSKMYARMMKDLGVDPSKMGTFHETEHLIETAMHYCKQPNPAYGMGALCLAAEAIVPDLYSDIITGFLANGVTAEQVNFFRIHVDCDDGHAETMRQIMERMESERPKDLRLIKVGNNAMMDARLEFFTGVLNGAKVS
jgi:pyrroloquinoline-quinone synthase